MAINLPPRGRIENGWPFVNYASDERNFNSAPGGARSNTLSIPRMKFTYLVEFQINQRILTNPITNINDFIHGNGKLYTHLRSLDHPRPQMKVETLRSYNKWIKIPTTIEFSPASMTFHDDSTSVVMALWKEHTHFYSHLATVGEDISGVESLSRVDGNNEINSYQFTHILTGEEMRSKMGQRPSLGMKLKPNDMRHFFESIVIYDLGTEPDGVNVYWFHHPVITSWDHDNLDKEDRTGNVGVSANFEYESYYFTVGQNRGRIRGFIETILGNFPETEIATQRKDGIARDGRNTPLDQPVELASQFPGSMFPGEDALILQELARGASPGALGTPEKAAENLKNDAGYGDFESDDFDSAGGVTPFGPEEESNLIEPLSPAQTATTFPLTTEGKENKLRRIEEEKEKISPASGDDLKRREELNNNEKVVGEALRKQRALERARDIKNKATQSALENTKIRANIPPPRPVATAATNPNNQARLDKLLDSIPRVEQQAQTYIDIAATARVEAQAAADRGDNLRANSATTRAIVADKKATEELAIANRLRDTADSLTPN